MHSSTRDLNYTKTRGAAKGFTSSSARAWFKPQPCWKCRMFLHGTRRNMTHLVFQGLCPGLRSCFAPCSAQQGCLGPGLCTSQHVASFCLSCLSHPPPPCQSIRDLLSAPEHSRGNPAFLLSQGWFGTHS